MERRRLPNSLALRMVLWTTAACAGIFLLAGVVLGVWLRYVLVDEFDRALLARAQAIAALVVADGGGVRVETAPDVMAGFEAGGRKAFYEVWDERGRAVLRSPSLGAAADLPKPDFGRTDPVYARMQFPDGRHGRTVSIVFPLHEGGGGGGGGGDGDGDGTTRASGGTGRLAIVVAVATHDMSENLSETLWLVFWVFVAAVVAAVVVVGWAAVMGLRPIQAITGRIAATGEDNLSERFDEGTLPVEFRPIAERLNDLLARIEAVVTRERGFTADVAHELRTPISGLEAALEVAASRRREPEEYARVTARCLATVRGMHKLVDDLLLLARADARQITPVLGPVLLIGLLREGWVAFERRAADRRLSVRWEVDGGVDVLTDATLMGVVVRNVFDNAVSYAEEGGSVEVVGRGWARRFEVVVRNTGCGLSAGEVRRAFDRFWRADASRSANGTHAGLGLSLCQKVMPLLGGSIEVGCEPGGVFAVTLRGPVPPPPPPSAAPSESDPASVPGTSEASL